MAAVSTGARIAVDGKFFRVAQQKWHLKGVAYGPFAPNVAGEFFPEPEQAEADLQHIVELGANTLRVYYPPPAWLLELAEQRGLKLFVDVPWAKHLCFLDSEEARAEARRAVRDAALLCAWHPAVFALSVVNEIPPDIVRWSGAAAIAGFIELLIEEVKAVDPELLCTFGNYPPTEFLRVPNLDFVCYNIYLHHERAFENYLARLQMIADTRPLVLGEIGIDSLREGEAGQTEMLSWQIERACRNGAAGTVIFSFTDRWFKNDQWIEDWSFGLVRRDGSAKPAFFAVQQRYRAAPHFPLADYPEVSVVVASYNGARTLRSCLESLCALNYPRYEVILVDDGSTDETPSIVADFPSVRSIQQSNLGLSVARNTGIACARGEIIAFTDSDCRADPDWLYYLVGDLLRQSFAGVGGHNFLPPDDSWIAAAVMASPGGPAHVMVTDRVAEHVPGCNMAFYKWALIEIGGFDPIFRRAGDDVDVCWRLQQRGYQIGFSPGGFVWHYRRSTARDYLEQQYGYGEAEALLVRKHPEYFNAIGGSLWQGRIYSHAHFGVSLRPGVIYHGPFGSGLFQSVYAAPPTAILSFFTSIEYYVVVTLPLLVLSIAFGILTPLAITSLVLSAVVCVIAAGQAEIPRAKRRFWSRPLVALLYFLQPIVRGTARYQGRLHLATEPLARPRLSPSARGREGSPPAQLYYWSDGTGNRLLFLKRIIESLDEQGWPNKTDAGWNDFDVEIFGNRWSRLQLLTATEGYAGEQQRICCRLQTHWSLSALVLFWSVVVMELLIIGVLGRLVPALWSLLFSLPLIGWLLQRQGARLQWDVTQFLDGVASHCGLIPDPARPS